MYIVYSSISRSKYVILFQDGIYFMKNQSNLLTKSIDFKRVENHTSLFLKQIKQFII